jgi:hypothetical protein
VLQIKHQQDFDVFIIVELFFECIDRRPFLDCVFMAFRENPFGTSLEWNMFARSEFNGMSLSGIQKLDSHHVPDFRALRCNISYLFYWFQPFHI